MNCLWKIGTNHGKNIRATRYRNIAQWVKQKPIGSPISSPLCKVSPSFPFTSISSSVAGLIRNSHIYVSTQTQNTKCYSATSSTSTNSAESDIDSSRLKTVLTKKGKPLLPSKDLVFGRTFTDHMLSIEWTAGKGWGTPRIHPYEKICLEPSAVVFHYAIECFEGMKAYKDKIGNTRLFRPDMNMNRLFKSAKRMYLPSFNKSELTECIKELLKVDEKWIPFERGYSLYIRPTIIGTQESLGVGPSNRALLFVICSPVGPYYRTGFAAVNLLATTSYVRAWPGGTGDAKIGANYAPGIRPQIEAAQDGYQQNLWLFGKDYEITEVGTMNCFVYWINEKGEKELATPSLDGTILPGVTRDSILSLARSWGEFKVTERKIKMEEIISARNENRLLEMFGAGTACIVSPIKKISFQGKDIDIPLDPSNPKNQAGPLTKRFADTIMDIQYGDVPSPWSVIVK